jgi:hypothetical protein
VHLSLLEHHRGLTKTSEQRPRGWRASRTGQARMSWYSTAPDRTG